MSNLQQSPNPDNGSNSQALSSTAVKVLENEFNIKYEGIMELDIDEEKTRSNHSNSPQLQVLDAVNYVENSLKEKCGNPNYGSDTNGSVDLSPLIENLFTNFYHHNYRVENNQDKSDLFNPIFLRGNSNCMQALCPWCHFEGHKVELSFNTRSYCNHLNLIHGISSSMKCMYPLPLSIQYGYQVLNKAFLKLKGVKPKIIKKGYCNNCSNWINMDFENICSIQNPFFGWWKHCQQCYDQEKDESISSSL